MRIVFEGFKKGISIFWDDSISLILFNFICFLSLLPALLFFSVTNGTASVLTSIINTVLFLPSVFFIFPLYHVLFDGRKDIVISFRSFFWVYAQYLEAGIDVWCCQCVCGADGWMEFEILCPIW